VLSSFPLIIENKKILCLYSRGQEFPVVPPQFTPYVSRHTNHPAQMAKYTASDTDDSFSAYLWSLMGSKQIRRLYRALPVFTYWGTGPFREATPKGIPHQTPHCLAPTGSSLGEAK